MTNVICNGLVDEEQSNVMPVDEIRERLLNVRALGLCTRQGKRSCAAGAARAGALQRRTSIDNHEILLVIQRATNACQQEPCHSVLHVRRISVAGACGIRG